MKIIKRIVLIFLVILLAAKIILSTALLFCAQNTAYNETAIDASQLIEMTNDYRLSRDLQPLAINPRLTQAAVNKAQDLLAKNYFSHTSPEGRRFSEWIKEVNYRYFYVGENLAIDFDSNENLFEAWLDSPLHKKNILRPQYQEIGIAALSGNFADHQTTVVVQIFGTRVLGENEKTAGVQPLNPIKSHFTTQPFWKRITLSDWKNINQYLDYLIIIVLTIFLLIHKTYRKKRKINIKQPIINRYQAKAFKE